METKQIETLLEKYWEAETSIEEEKILKQYFQQSDIPAHLKIFQAQFQLFHSSKENEKLDEEFDNHFDTLVSLSKQKTTPIIPLNTVSRNVYLKWTIGVAASILIFVSGIFIGRNMGSNAPQSQDLNALRNEIKKTNQEMGEIKKEMMLSQLKKESASERIQAVNTSQEIKGKSPEVLDALILTLNTDENSNVRIAAANALFAFKEIEKVREALIQSLSQQDDPVVKIALVNMMMVLKDKKAKEKIEEFLQNEPLPENAKQDIRKRLNNL